MRAYGRVHNVIAPAVAKMAELGNDLILRGFTLTQTILATMEGSARPIYILVRMWSACVATLPFTGIIESTVGEDVVDCAFLTWVLYYMFGVRIPPNIVF